MKFLTKILALLLLLGSLRISYAVEFEETIDTIEIRKAAMQNLWQRIKRLSPYVELKEKVEYNKDLAVTDAQEVINLLEQTKNLWPLNSNISGKGFTNATPAIWVLPDYFEKLYSSAEKSAYILKQSILDDDIDSTISAMCNLGTSCGTCHANFRRLLTSQLANEVSGWSGQYVNGCK
ncbi:MAG: hypothetical protein CBC22_03750 [Alphaproteobacteria bacterium TMED62]|nr:MAG: hypothetical protein CBC22_03750 [Alphaproteobacteria bacterium TMED62]|tara:strand:- start:390 stop:923 length:534 start_codon:yes stop_codon:yes gene_type:complete